MNAGQHWILTGDTRSVTLFGCRRTPEGELHLQPLRSLENIHEGEHEHHRPTMVGGAERRATGGTGNRSGASAAPHCIGPGHDVEEEQHRFARDVGGWLVEATKEVAAPG